MSQDTAPADPRLLVLFVTVGAILLLAVGLQRPIDADEGFYHYNSFMAASGSLPYRDFIHPQLPYNLYAYAPAGHALMAARIISILFGVTALAWFAAIVRPQGTAGLIALFLLTTTALFALWVPVYKTYAMTLAGSLMAFHLSSRPTLERSFATGLIIGLITGSRLLYAPLWLVFAIRLARPPADRRRRLALLAAGSAVALLPCVFLAAADPQRFWWDVVEYHSVRTSQGTVGDWDQKVRMAEILVTRPQWAVLWLLAGWGFLHRRSPEAWAAGGCAAVLTLVSFLPTPTYEQYFVCVIPFLLILALPVLRLLDPRRHAIPGALLISLYAANFWWEHGHEWYGTWNRLEEADQVAATIRRHAGPGEEILCFWPGYAVWSGTRAPSGLENTHVYGFETLDASQREFLGVPEPEEIREWIRSGRHRVLQLGWHMQPKSEIRDLRREAESHGYKLAYGEWDRYVYFRP